MRTKKLSILALMSCLVLTVACSNAVHKYHTSDLQPRMVYVGGQLEPIRTADLSNGEKIYAEVRTTEGVKETGKLIRISENDLILSEGYYYSTVNDSLKRFESQKVIPKEDILILKVW
jgi:predicted DNA-binding antitoxin AbrB/MazE fold protein